MKPVVSRPSRRLNYFGKNHRHTVDEIFITDVVPTSGKKFALSRGDCKKYVTKRQKPREMNDILPDVFRYQDFSYEMILHEFFWNKNSTHFGHSRLLVVEGEVGVGKTTLVNYYLRSFCLVKKPDAFKTKVIVNFDARQCTSTQNFEILLCQSIELAVERFVNFNQIDTYSDKIPKANRNPSALGYLSEVCKFLKTIEKEKNIPFYICFVFDNLDQVDPKIINQSFIIINHLLEESGIYDIWKIIVTLWPDTFNYVRSTYSTIMTDDKFSRVSLPPVDKWYLGNRQRHTLKSVKKNFHQVYQNDTTTMIPQKYFSIKFKRLKRLIRRCAPELEKMSYNDNRVYNEHIRNLFISDYVDNTYKYMRRVSHGDLVHEWAAYTFWDCIIKGEYEFFSGKTSKILNLFDPLNGQMRNCHPLLGFHIVYLLRESRSAPEEEILKKCQLIGHSSEDAADLLRMLRFNNFYHQVDIRSDRTIIKKHWDVLNWYYRACSRPYYIDNMALVTPLPESYHPGMRPTKFFDEKDFVSKSLSTLCFIEYIRDVEIGMKPETDIPFLWVKMAKKYFDRLRGLRRSRKHLVSVSAEDWNKLMSVKIMRDIRNAVEE